MGHHLFHLGFGRVDHLAGEEEPQGAAEAVDVGAGVGAFGVHGLLGGHVFEGAGDGAGLGDALGVGCFAVGVGARLQTDQAEVGHLDPARGVHEEVGGLDVAVDHALGVDISHGLGGLDGGIDRARDLEGAALGDQVQQVIALDELHDEVVATGALVGIVGGDDARMGQLRDGLDLALEALQAGGVLEHLAVEHLQRHDALHPLVASLEHGAHAAGPELAEDHIIAQHQLVEPAIEDFGHLVGCYFAGGGEDRQGGFLGALVGGGVRLAEGVFQVVCRHDLGFHHATQNGQFGCLHEHFPDCVPGGISRCW